MNKIVLSVSGMTCQHCVRTISASISDVPGVQAVQVDLDSKQVEVTGDVDEPAVRAALIDAGYEAA